MSSRRRDQPTLGGAVPILPVLALASLFVGCVLIGPSYPDLPPGFEGSGLAELPAGAPIARVPADAAVSAAQQATGITEAPSGVGRRWHRLTRRTVWVVVFAVTGQQRPCGPAPLPGEQPGRCATNIAGVVLDDQTGAIDHTFEMGSQLLQ